MEKNEELILELAGIIEDLCRNQAKTLKQLAASKDLPDALREIVLDRVKYMELSHHKIRKFIEKVQPSEGSYPPR
ncbi:MAG: hypothetical protein ACM3OG_11395 [Actinomycetota bacterium]